MKPERRKLGDNGDARRRKEKWWLWGRYTPALFAAIAGLDRVLAVSRVSQQAGFAFLPNGTVYADRPLSSPSPPTPPSAPSSPAPHEIWARCFGSSMKDDLRYTPSDCFDTFSFPEGWDTHPALEAAGRAYYEHRAALMVETTRA